MFSNQLHENIYFLVSVDRFALVAIISKFTIAVNTKLSIMISYIVYSKEKMNKVDTLCIRYSTLLFFFLNISTDEDSLNG